MTIKYDVTYHSILRPVFQHHGTLETRKSTGRCANIAGNGSHYGKFWINDWVSSRIYKNQRKKSKKRPCSNKKSIRSSILKISNLMHKTLSNDHNTLSNMIELHFFVRYFFVSLQSQPFTIMNIRYITKLNIESLDIQLINQLLEAHQTMTVIVLRNSGLYRNLGRNVNFNKG